MPETTTEPVSAAIGRWRDELVAAGGRDALVDYRDLPTGTLDLATAHPSGLAQFLAGRPTRLSSLFREPGALTAARKRARAIRLAAVQLADQHGVGGSYLAVGMVRWQPPGGRAVQAPVLLRPLTLRPRGAGQVDDDLDLGDQVRANPALLRLLADHGVRLDAGWLAQLATGDHGFTPRPALEALRDAASRLPGLTVTERTVVGIFVDVVPALLADLDRHAGALERHPVARALAGGSFGRVGLERDAGSAAERDVPFAVTQLDRDQRRVVQAVAAGRSLHVSAPPGTGATRLLTQLLVTQAGLGRRTLLVTTQRAEVAGVVDALAALGLGELVRAPGGLLTGTRTARTGGPPLDDAPVGPVDDSAAEAALQSLADQRATLHRRHERYGVSVLEALHALTRLSDGPTAPCTTVRLDPDATTRLAGPGRREVAGLLREVADLGAFAAGAQQSPWYGASLSGEEEAVKALAAVERLASQSLPELRAQMARIASVAGLSGASSVVEWARQIDLLVAVRATLDTFTPEVYERSVADMVAATATNKWREEQGVRMSTLERRRWRKQARDLLRPGTQPANLHEALLRAQAQRFAWQQHATGGGWPRVPAGLAEADAAYHAVRTDLELLDRVLGTTAAGGGLVDAPLEDLEPRLDRLAARDEVTSTLPRRVAATARLRDLGLQDLLTDLLRRRVPADRVTDELELSWWTSALEHSLADSAVGDSGWAPSSYERARQAAWMAAAAAVRDRERSRAESSCTAVSPLSLPQALAGRQQFDLVVLAGGHRCGVAEGVLAMARGGQVLVIGDPGGLPPATLDLTPEDSDTEPGAVRTSVLEASAPVLPQVRLAHQHRMPTQLLTPDDPAWSVPAPDGGLRLEVVREGTGRPDAEGGVESVDAEVQRVVRLVLDHARERPEQSLGVITVTRHHARRVADAVRAELPEHPDLAPYFLKPAGEPFVVTDLSRCEDAVRDAVVVSIGFGQTPRGRVLHRFGPLDSDGGERGLAVAMTRSRRSTTVVCCFGAEDLDPEKLKTPGALALRDLLGRAVAGTPAPASSGATAGPLLDDLAERLRQKGFTVTSGGVPDLAVMSDGGRPVAVMTDARWVPSGGDSSAVRDLVLDDLSVAQHLRRFGWHVVQLSSIDLFTDVDAAERAVVSAARRPA